MNGTQIKIFITGGSGFIGKNLIEYLTKINTNQNKYLLFYPGHAELDLLDAEKIYRYVCDNDIDQIVHCANIGGSRKTAYDVGQTDVVYKNLRMFFNLLRASEKVKRIIVFGTGAEYDRRFYKPRMSEEYFDAHVPEDAYGFSKYVISKYIEESDKVVNLRLFGVFGKYEEYEYKFISNAIVKNLFGLPIVINQNVYFDYLYINDLLRMVECFLDLNRQFKHKIFNAVRGETIDLLTVAQKINQISERPSEIIVKNPGLNIEYSASNGRLLSELGDFQYTPLEEALRELYAWYKGKLPEIDRETIEEDNYIKYCRTKKQN